MTRRRSLNLERWELCDFDPGAGEVLVNKREPGWRPVAAPGDTYQALIDAGRLAHPFQRRNETAAAWVRDRVWWWRTSFEAPLWQADEIVEIVFEGLDTFAHVYLDGILLGQTDNMFRRYRFEIGEHLKAGGVHQLAVRFDPPGLAVAPRVMPVWGAFTDRVSSSKRNLMRKAQFGWGWDWGPDLPTVGVWRPARLEVRPRAAIADLHFATLALAADVAHVVFDAELIGQDDGVARAIEMVLTNPQGEVVFKRAQAAGGDAIRAQIQRPQLWWTADLGAQPLYRLAARLIEGERVIDEGVRTVGIRTIVLDQSPDPDEPGTNFFQFILNGAQLFAKGACWVPADSFVGDISATTYQRLIDQAVKANMNMIRVWGGGIYEPDLFYDLCDEKGLLVWQDFMFACAHYPDDPDFAATVSAEVEDQVRRLRHHPCLALWCGNNENQAAHQINAEIAGDRGPLGGAALYDKTIPELLRELHPEAPYWPSSPWGGPHPNSMRAGDVHDWTVWHGLPPVHDATMGETWAWSAERAGYTRYAENMSRFVSEFGIQGAPALATLGRWMDADDLDHRSEGFRERIKDEARKLDGMMTPITGLPNTLREYVDFSQWTQAEGLKFGIEHFRRRRPHCSGALLWQFNDCWPCVSWSLIDYDGVEKAAYYAVRRAFSPVLASFAKGPGKTVDLWITNDTLRAVECDIVVALESLDGRTIWRETMVGRAAPGGHAIAWSGEEPDARDLVLRVWSPSGAFPPNRLLPAPIAELPLVRGIEPSVSFSRVGPKTLRVEIEAATYLPFVHLLSERPDLRFSDNYFDLASGESRNVIVTGAGAIAPHDITARAWA